VHDGVQHGLRQPEPNNAHSAQIKTIPWRIPNITSESSEKLARQLLFVELADGEQQRFLQARAAMDKLILLQIQVCAQCVRDSADLGDH
jgi:hypothetical protein